MPGACSMSSLICSTRQAALSPRCRRSIPVRAGLQPGPSRRELLLGAGMSAAGLVLPQGLLAREQSAYDFVADMSGQQVALSKYCKGKNVNYPSLKELSQKYGPDGFVLVGFPCNQFGGQAPGSSEEERKWAYFKFKTEFPVFDKIEVNGDGAHPLYKFLKAKQPESLPTSSLPRPAFVGQPGSIEWNYTKFLVDRGGNPVRRFKSGFDPMSFEDDVKLLLAGKPPRPAECARGSGGKKCKAETYL
eukprot:jgi/Astpho2/8412/Aster-01465